MTYTLLLVKFKTDTLLSHATHRYHSTSSLAPPRVPNAHQARSGKQFGPRKARTALATAQNSLIAHLASLEWSLGK